MKLNSSIIFLLILVFHVLITAQSFYSMFGEYEGWTIYHWRPFGCLFFTIIWFGAYKKWYNWGLAYIAFVMIEFLLYAAFKENTWAQVFGQLLFPIDLIFTAVLLYLFKSHFGVLPRPDELPDNPV